MPAVIKEGVSHWDRIGRGSLTWNSVYVGHQKTLSYICNLRWKRTIKTGGGLTQQQSREDALIFNLKVCHTADLFFLLVFDAVYWHLQRMVAL
jgi:hypothetical protein